MAALYLTDRRPVACAPLSATITPASS